MKIIYIFVIEYINIINKATYNKLIKTETNGDPQFDFYT